MKGKTFLKSIIVLVGICLFIAVAMAAVNMLTAPRIEEAQKKAEAEALSAVLPDNAGFEKIEGTELPECVSALYADLDGDGMAAMLSIKGYDSSKPMSVVVGFDGDGKITECVVISASGETSGIGSKVTLPSFLEQFSGKGAELEGVDAISGATISSQAFIDAVRESCALVGGVDGGVGNE